MAEHEILVEFSMVQETYDGETLVVKHLDLDIRRGEFLTFLGPSGSGKTTTLMMLAGFEMPTYGDIMLRGRAINTMPPHKRNIGMVFQNYALFPHMTVEGRTSPFRSPCAGYPRPTPRGRCGGRCRWSGCRGRPPPAGAALRRAAAARARPVRPRSTPRSC